MGNTDTSLGMEPSGTNASVREDPDRPPSFPIMDGPQVARGPLGGSTSSQMSARGSAAPTTDTKRAYGKSEMPPPSISGPSLRVPRPAAGSSLMPPPSTTAAAPLRLAPARSSASSAGLLAPSAPKAKRNKVALAPGFGPLDWARLKSSGKPELRVCVNQAPLNL